MLRNQPAIKELPTAEMDRMDAVRDFEAICWSELRSSSKCDLNGSRWWTGGFIQLVYQTGVETGT